jgi:hypothetical protein
MAHCNRIAMGVSDAALSNDVNYAGVPWRRVHHHARNNEDALWARISAHAPTKPAIIVMT